MARKFAIFLFDYVLIRKDNSSFLCSHVISCGIIHPLFNAPNREIAHVKDNVHWVLNLSGLSLQSITQLGVGNVILFLICWLLKISEKIFKNGQKSSKMVLGQFTQWSSQFQGQFTQWSTRWTSQFTRVLGQFTQWPIHRSPKSQFAKGQFARRFLNII